MMKTYQLYTIFAASSALLAALGLPSARAGVTQSTAEAQTNVNGTFPAPNPRFQDSGVVTTLGGSATPATASDNEQYTDPNGQYIVQGQISAKAGAGIVKLSAHWFANNLSAGAMVGMDSTAQAQTFDLVQITAGSSAGTVKVSDWIDGSASGNGTQWASDIALDVTIINTGVDLSKSLTYHVTEEKYYGYDGTHSSQSGPAEIPIDPGDTVTIQINEILTTYASSNAGATATVTGSYGDTTHLYLDPSPGVQFTTTSGHDYSTPVPEPASLALLGLGAAVLPTRRRRAGR